MVEHKEMDHITVKGQEDEELIDVSNILTLDSLQVELDQEREILKRAYFLANPGHIVMEIYVLSLMIAAPINRFLDSTWYRKWGSEFLNDVLMGKTHLDTTEANQIITKYSPS